MREPEESFQPGYLRKVSCYFSRFNLFDLLVIIICAASFGCSLIESMVNVDNYHWGGAYLQAVDIKRGAIPHSGVLIFYGYIYSWIQSVALELFGERLISLGMITGLFYSLSLFLSYLVFLRFLNKNLAFVSVLLIFLIHPYIIYPFPNYFAYAFQLLALIFFLRYSQNPFNGFATGFFLCMSVLSRYSSVIAILPPFIILLCWQLLTVRDTRKHVMKKMGMIGSGFLIPLILFFIYLHMNSALDDFFYQNKMIIKLWGNIDDVNTFLNFLASFVQVVPSMADDFRGKLFTLIFIICLFILVREG
ncbi:MAG: glycosyltransferase family 39 protein, partial [Smithella sp.]